MNVGDLVKVNPRGKAYRVYAVDSAGACSLMQPIRSGRSHPDAAKRAPHDALDTWDPNRLIYVGRDE